MDNTFGENKEYYYKIESEPSVYDTGLWRHRIYRIGKNDGSFDLVAEIIGKNVETYDSYEGDEEE